MGPAGIRPRTATAGRTALLAHERDGGHAATRLAALARPAIPPYPRRIVDRLRLKFLSRIKETPPMHKYSTPLVKYPAFAMGASLDTVSFCRFIVTRN